MEFYKNGIPCDTRTTYGKGLLLPGFSGEARNLALGGQIQFFFFLSNFMIGRIKIKIFNLNKRKKSHHNPCLRIYFRGGGK